MLSNLPTPRFLTPSQSQARAGAHRERMLHWVGPHLARRTRGERHPVFDFLFDYYPARASRLLLWTPGPDLVVSGEVGRALSQFPEYKPIGEGVKIDTASWPTRRLDFLHWLGSFLEAVAERPAHHGCFGLHEWAMVYGLSQEQVRHAGLPLRLHPTEIARVVETSAICCSHFDAFRFFTAQARPLNRWPLQRETQLDMDQPGCLHANMDLYKWALKLLPFTPGELLADCFELAWDIREVDMRASPYDTARFGLPPIKIETAVGREEYVALQRRFTERSQPLRERLLSLVRRLLEDSSDKSH